MTDPKDAQILSLQKIISSHDEMINRLAHALADHTMILTAMMQHCDERDCTRLATWTNIVNGVHMCDKCCKVLTAEAVSHGAEKHNVESEWEEDMNAKSIRFIDAHSSIISSATTPKQLKTTTGNDFN